MNKTGKTDLLSIILIGAVIFFLFKGNMGTTQSTVTTNVPIASNNIVTGDCPAGAIEDVTVTFSNIDLYAQGTAVTQGARLLLFDNDINAQVSNGGTKTYSPGDSYKVLMGNLTTGFTAGTTYYPQYTEGSLGKCKGTDSLIGKLAKSTTQANLEFTYWNSNDAAGSPQPLGANDEKTVRFRFAAPDNACFGNPYAEKMGGKNVMCVQYNTTVISSVIVDNATTAAKPRSATVDVGKDISCYGIPVVCDNGEYNGKMMIKTTSTAPSVAAENITISMHDVTFDYNADTLDLIIGVEDEPKSKNDIGVTDFNLGNSFAYSVGIN